jgi:hypothetical protein
MPSPADTREWGRDFARRNGNEVQKIKLCAAYDIVPKQGGELA